NPMLSSHAFPVMNVQVMVITRLLKYLLKKHLPQRQIQQNFRSNSNMAFVPGRQKELFGTHLISAAPTQQAKINLKWMLVFTTVYLEKVMAKLQVKVAASIRARALVYPASGDRLSNILKQ